ncbi:MAG TPA: MFS transporter, partial [Jiangellaceae bacterium]|nr:MFS transporter [Jiangellaceae bacterium]
MVGSPSRSSRWLLIVAVIAVGLTLRSTIAAIPPVLEAISFDLNLDGATAGLLTSLPVLCFAIGSSLVTLATHRIRTNPLILLSLLVLAIAVAVRPWGGTFLLLAGTAVMGLAITVGNVLLPTVVRRDFPRHIGPMTAVTSSTLNIGAAITAALTVPMAVWLGGWRGANASWALLGVVAAGLWVIAARHTAPDTPAPAHVGTISAVWRSGDAWWLGAFFGLQSALYYTTTQWLPSILQDAATLSRELAGTGLSLYQL